MLTPPSYTPTLVSSAGNDGTREETKYRSLVGPSYELNVSAKGVSSVQINEGPRPSYGSKISARGYGLGGTGYPHFRKRRPRRPFFGRGCSYCGGSFNDKRLVATAVNSAGRLVDTKRLSIPHCDSCGNGK